MQRGIELQPHVQILYTDYVGSSFITERLNDRRGRTCYLYSRYGKRGAIQL